ncbi:MAG TPA: polysaccharide deacetylase family protein [Treponemataceae bacterium]|nr:polysaccharide deacetylase family protein [Treponemataceae bacterium]
MKNKKNRYGFVFLCMVFLYSGLNAIDLEFSGLDLNAENGLLFTAKIASGTNTWHNLYKTTLSDIAEAASIGEPKLLTYFPEKLDVFQDGKFLQIRNTDGVFLYSSSKNTVSKISTSPSLFPSPQNSAKIRDNLSNISVSPNGKWVCYFDKTSYSRGNLVLKNTETGKKQELANDTEFCFEKIPVRWCPDSSMVIYEKKSHLYFISPKDVLTNTLLDEQYRSIGPGVIGNVCWASEKKLVYICHDLVFSILTHEMYTRALYSELVGVGDICGRLSTAFNGERDTFWIDESCKNLILVDNNRTLWYIELDGTENNYVTTLFSYPFVNVPGTAIDFKVFWTPLSAGAQIPIVWLEMFRNGKKESHAYRLVRPKEGDHAWFENVPLPASVHSPKLSPDRKKLSFASNDFVLMYDLVKWEEEYRISGEKIISYVWVDSSSMYVGGQKTIRYWKPSENILTTLLISSAEKYAWDGMSGHVVANAGGENYFYNDDTKVWDKTETPLSRQTLSRNTFWRVFIDKSRNENYKNAIYVRSLAGTNTTKPLLQTFYQPNPHTKKIALVFDALDNSDGMATILSVLNKYGIEATFFLNGEFIRRFPFVVKEISDSGHECASMFYTVANLASNAFIPDESFIMRGLARNEDEFFELTGNELILAWHTPSYVNTPLIQNAGTSAGYTYVDRSFFVGDTNTIEKAAKTGIPYVTSGVIVENIAEKIYDKQIIPISCGLSLGTRPDYLYDKLDVLVSAILGQGYAIVPVSNIIWK